MNARSFVASVAAAAGVLAATSCVGMSTPTGSATSALGTDLEVDTNRLGDDYRTFELDHDDPSLCALACANEPQCKAFTYVKPGYQGPVARCWLKWQVPTARAESCCVSGVADETPADTDAGHP